MKETLENELLEVIDVNTIANLEQGTKAAKKCAIVARDYAKRFAEWIHSEGYTWNVMLGGWETINSVRIWSTANLLIKFDKETAENEKA